MKAIMRVGEEQYRPVDWDDDSVAAEGGERVGGNGMTGRPKAGHCERK